LATSDKVRKHKERASKYISKGKYDNALEEYERAVKIAPSDLSVRQKLAETYARVGRKQEAVREYQSVAGSYAADGLLLKAIAISKVLLTVDPHHKETQEILARLYAERRGGLATVSLPKNMSAAVNKKRSAADIRGAPARSIVPKTGEVIDQSKLNVVREAPAPAQPPATASASTSSDGIEIDIDVGSPDVIIEELPADEGFGIEIDDGEDGIDIEIEEAQVDVQELPPIPLFSDLDADAFVTLTERMELITAEPGEMIIAEGEYAASMYVIIQGTMKVVREGPDGGELKLAELGDGAFFGEMALLTDAPRTASVVSTDDAMLFEISRALMDEIVEQHPSVAEVLRRFHKNRLLTNLLKTSALFAPFGVDDKRSLIEKFKSRHVDAGKVLITKERSGKALYVLLNGRCEVIGQDDTGRDVVIAELKDGDVFGEMSLLFKQSASATVRTLSPCIVLRLAREQFDELIMTHPQVLETLARISEERESYNRDLLAPSELPPDVGL
jgi:CRP-like cAMP-binding protein